MGTQDPDVRAEDAGDDAPPRVLDPRDIPVNVQVPAWFRRALIMVVAASFLAIALGWLFLQLSGFIVTVVVAMFIGFAMEPAVNAMARRGVPRAGGTLLVMLLLFLAFGAFAWIIGALIVEQVGELVDNFPDYVDETTRYVDDHFGLDLTEQSDQLKDVGLSSASGLAGSAFGFFTTAVGIIFQLFTVGLFSFYFCARGPELRRTVCSALPPRQQRETLRAWNLAIQKTAGYLYSRMLLGLASAIAHGICFEVLDLDYSVTLALWVGLVSQFIPTVGTYLAGALPLLVALSSSPRDAVIVLIFIVAYQQFENYVLAPPLSARTMELNAAVAFGAVIVGTTLFGVPGAFLALPVTATGTAFAGAYIKRHQLIEHESLRLDKDDRPDDQIDTPEEAEATLPDDGPGARS